MLGFACVIFVIIITQNGVYACVRSGYVLSAFRDVCEILNGLLYDLYNWYS